MRLTVVGCSGSFPGPGSAASCYLVEADDAHGRTWRVLLDLGSGALGPLQRHVDLRDVDAVLLSHLHADHCLDLCGLYVALKYDPRGRSGRRLPVYGPHGTDRRMARAYDLPAEPGMTGEFEFRTWPQDGTVAIGPIEVGVRRVRHPVEAYAMRIEGPSEHGGRATLVYTGDTDSCRSLDEVARDADLLLAEAAFEDGRDVDRGIHLTAVRAGELARDARARALLLTHLPPWNDPDRAAADARRVFAGSVSLAVPDAVHLV